MKKRKTTLNKAGYWNKLVRKFYNLNGKVKKLLSSDASEQEVGIQLSRLQKLYEKLNRFQRKVGVTIAGTALALMLATTTSNAQDFKFQGYLSSTEYSPITSVPFVYPDFRDLDNDGDLDLYVGSYYGTIEVYENDGNNNFKQKGVLNMSGADLGFYSFFDFGDIDGDGDFDLIVDGSYYHMFLFENDGDNNFAFADTLRTTDGNVAFGGEVPFPDFADLDGDGDVDLYVGNIYGYIFVFLNDGTGQFTADGVLQADGVDINIGDLIVPEFEDLDGDGDLDLYAGLYDGYIQIYENDGGTFTSSGFLEVDGSAFTGAYVNFHTFADVDDDGDMELYVAEFYSYMYKFDNDGTNTFTSDGTFDVTGALITFTYFSSPAVADVDGDGNVELYVGGAYGEITQFDQLDDFDFAFVDSLYADGDVLMLPVFPSPAYADVDDDGSLELFVSSYGYILKYDIDNNEDYFFADTLRDINGDYINSGWIGDVTFVDFGDGLDMFVSGNGFMLQYETNSSEEYTFVDTVRTSDNNIILDYYPSPAFADIDGDGDVDMLVGMFYGQIYIYRNDGSGSFDQDGMLQADGTDIEVFYLARPEFADIDYDGDLDLVVGEYGYGAVKPKIRFYRNDEIVISTKEITAENMLVYPNPTTGLVTIQNSEGYNVQVIDINGRIIRSFTDVNESNLKIDLTDQSNGVYIIRLFNDAEVKTAKIIVE